VPQLEDITSAAGVSFSHTSDPSKKYIVESMSGGVLLIEHNMRVVMGACSRVQVIDGGKTIAEGTPEEIQRHDDVIRAYLGTKSGRERARGR